MVYKPDFKGIEPVWSNLLSLQTVFYSDLHSPRNKEANTFAPRFTSRGLELKPQVMVNGGACDVLNLETSEKPQVPRRTQHRGASQ